MKRLKESIKPVAFQQINLSTDHDARFIVPKYKNEISGGIQNYTSGKNNIEWDKTFSPLISNRRGSKKSTPSSKFPLF